MIYNNMTIEEMWIREKLGQTDFNPKYLPTHPDFDPHIRPAHLRFDKGFSVETTNTTDNCILSIFRDYLDDGPYNNIIYIITFHKGGGVITQVGPHSQQIITTDIYDWGTVQIIKYLMDEFGTYPKNELDKLRRNYNLDKLI